MTTPSPCRGLCALDPAGRLCTGCGRLAGEIARWPAADERERAAIAARAAARLAPGGGRGHASAQ